MRIVSARFSDEMGWGMTVRILKTRYVVGDRVRGMASLRVAGVVGNGAIADKAGKRIVEVQSRVGDGEKQAYDVL
jgi:hypothetical protein